MFLSKDNGIKWKLLSVATVVVALIVWVGIAWFDKPLFLLLRDFHCGVFTRLNTELFMSHTWAWLCVLIDKVFDAVVWIVGTAIIVCVFYVKKAIETKPNIRNSKHYINLWAIIRDFIDKTKTSRALYVLGAVLSASVIIKISKVFIGRMRPIFFEAQDITGFYPFISDWAFNSMPSGHAGATFAGLVMLGMLMPKIKWATWTLAIIVGVSRVCIGAHWPTDVILGAFIGMVCADFVKSYIKRRLAD